MSDAEMNETTEVSSSAAQPSVVETNFSETGTTSTPAPAPAKTKAATESKLDSIKKAAKEISKEAPSIDGASPHAATPVEPNPYKPNFKMKVDKQEKEIDEFFRTLIKDPDSEEKVRKTLQKAEAFETQAQRHERLKQEHESLNTRFSGIDKSLRSLSKHLNEDDMESFCASLKIDDQKILRYAQRILQKMEMDPNQRAQEERVRQDRLRANQLEEQNQYLQTEYQKQQAEAGLMQTEMLLSKPEYAQMAQSFDQHVKRDGAFFEEVCKQGILAEKTTGRILSPEEAVQAALNVWAPFLNFQAPPQAQTVQQQQQPQRQAQPPPTIPNISGRASSPIKQPVRSIADLKKLSNQI